MIMDEYQILGYIIVSLITIGSFVGLVAKFIQPINELRIAIQKLIDNLDTLKLDSETQTKRIDAHGKEIDKLDGRVGKLETKMDIYHHNDK